jgi:predicted nuclease of restriction endonuclease-like RecB superfamily
VLLAEALALSLRAEVHGLRDSSLLVVVGLGLLAVAGWAVRKGISTVSTGLFAVATLFWLAFNGRVEGPTLFRLSHRHGVTWADLLPFLLLCGLLVSRRRSRRKPQSAPEERLPAG